MDADHICFSQELFYLHNSLNLLSIKNKFQIIVKIYGLFLLIQKYVLILLMFLNE